MILQGCGSQKNNNVDRPVISKDTFVQQSKNNAVVINETNNNENLNTTNAPSTINIFPVNDFTLGYATSQRWHGGIKGSGGGINYDVSIVSLFSSAQLIIDELWIGEKFHEISASRRFPKTSADGFVAGDTIYIHASDYIKDPDVPKQVEEVDGQKETQDTLQNTPPPKKYTGEALIGYKINGNRKYKEIEKFSVKPALCYP